MPDSICGHFIFTAGDLYRGYSKVLVSHGQSIPTGHSLLPEDLFMSTGRKGMIVANR
jgi:hypothetical protein